MNKLSKALGLCAVASAMVIGASQASLAADKKADVILGTAGTSGTYYLVGAAMAQAISNHSSFLNVVAQPSRGSLENINNVHSGAVQFGMANSDAVFFAYNGAGSYEKFGKRNIMGVMALYKSSGHMVSLKGNGIAKYSDLKGKKVNLGPPSTTIVEMSKAILREYGIDPKDDIKPFFLSIAEGLQKLTDGEIDASFFVAGYPTSGLMNAAATADIVMVDVDESILDSIVQKKPYFEKSFIPAGTYQGVDKNTNTLKITSQMFAGTNVPENVVYEYVKQALDNYDDYKDVHVVCKEISPESAAKTTAKLHPGAAKYFKEIGVLK